MINAELQLRHVFSITSGSTPDSNNPDFWDGHILWITPEDIGLLRNYYLIDTLRKITQKGYDSCGTSLVTTGSIVLTKRAPIGQAAILSKEACSNQGCFLLTPRSRVDTRFYYYLLKSQTQYLQILGRGSTFMELGTDDLKSLKVPFPEISHQRKISDFLDRETSHIDTLITEKENLLKLLNNKIRSIISVAVTRGLDLKVPLVHTGIAWLGEIPEHWNLLRAKYIFRQSSLPVRDNDEIVTCFRDGQVTLRRNRREEGFTNAIKELGYQGIRVGQLVLHSMDAFAGAIGVSDSDGKCSPEYIICDSINNLSNNFYYGYLLRVMALAGFIQASCPAVRERAPRIRFSDFGVMFLPMPPINEQNDIVEFILYETSKIKELILATEVTMNLLKERRSALISEAVTGKLDIGAFV